MWSREKLKIKAKSDLKNIYWKLFVLLILLVAVLGFGLIGVIVAVPFYLGIIRFILNSKKGEEKLEDTISVFKNSYISVLNVVFCIFLKQLLIFLWSLFFIIPGVIKRYEYYMIPYILADNPDIGFEKAKRLSQYMTEGHKLDMFMLEVSFLGWFILGALLFGVGNLFVLPYYEATKVELYLTLRDNIQINLV